MPTYTVHEPQPPSSDVDDRATALVFVKEGFAWFAFLTPALWMLFHRLWRGLLLYFVVAIGAVTLVQLLTQNANAVGWTGFFINLAFGFEARNIHRWALSAGKYTLIGIVTGRDLEDAERRFLTEWLPVAQAQARRPAAALPPPVGGGPIPIMGAGMAHG